MQMARRHCPRLVNLGVGSFDKPLCDWWCPDSSNVCTHFHRLTSSLRSESRAWITADLLPHPTPTAYTIPSPPTKTFATNTSLKQLHAHAHGLMLVCMLDDTHTKAARHPSNSWVFPQLYPQSGAGGRMQSAHTLAAWICHVEVNWCRL